MPDDKWEQRPLAGVVVAEGEQVTPTELSAFLEDRVAGCGRPNSGAWSTRSPKTSVGKFDKKVLSADNGRREGTRDG